MNKIGKRIIDKTHKIEIAMQLITTYGLLSSKKELSQHVFFTKN